MYDLTSHRKAHIMKARKTVAHPTNFVFFDTETLDSFKGKGNKVQRHQLWFGWLWGFRYEAQRVTRSIKGRFTTPDQFYDLLKKRLDPKRPLYVFAHNLAFDLTQVDFWNTAESRGLDCNYAVLENPPIFLSYEWEGCRLVILDTFNFWKVSVDAMGKSLGLPKLEMPKDMTDKKAWDDYCKRDVEVIGNQVIQLLDYLTENQLGSFAISAPALAMNCFKTKFLRHEIFLHDRFRVSQLERMCYYGGLVNNYYIGVVKNQTIHHTDVNSLYPSVMLNQYPVKLVQDAKDMRPVEAQKLLERYAVCARVKINSKAVPYIVRHGDKTMELTGMFTTSLCGPELKAALDRGHVSHVLNIAWYEQAKIFEDFVNFFWKERARYKLANDTPREQLVKLIMNSLYGKFGMKGFDWVDYKPENLAILYELSACEMPMNYWHSDYAPTVTNHTQIWRPEGLDRPVSLRYIAGKQQLKLPTGEHSESFCAIAAYVTSYARQRLRKLMAIAGHHHVYYCDTDSLFVDDVGLENLKSHREMCQVTLGKLKYEGSSDHAVFLGPKDYQFGSKVVVKGIRSNALQVSANTYEQDQFEGLKSVLNRGGGPYIEIKRIRKTNKRLYSKGTISSTGWTTPLSIYER